MNKFEFLQIKKINPEDSESWDGKIFLTFDIDWAHDAVIMDCYDLVRKYSVETTWFVTHQSDINHALAIDNQIELGIHPNFNELLMGTPGKSNLIIEKCKELVPSATSLRSHSLAQSERLIHQFLDNGFVRMCNLFIPYINDTKVFPYYLWDGAIIVPHRFQDNASLRMKKNMPSSQLMKRGLNVFDFHPIHVYLNTECLDRYERTRHLHHNPKELVKHRYEGFGTRSRLIQLLKQANIQ